MEATTVKSKRSLRKKAGDVPEPVEHSNDTVPSDHLNATPTLLEVSDSDPVPKEAPKEDKKDSKKEPKKEPKKESKRNCEKACQKASKEIVTIAEEGVGSGSEEDQGQGEDEVQEGDEDQEGGEGDEENITDITATNIQHLLDELDSDVEDAEEDGDDEDEEDEHDEEEDGDGEEGESTDFEEDDDTEWPASTVMYMPGVIDEKLVAYFQKYISKDSNKGRIFKPSMTLLIDDEDIDNTDLDEAEEIVDETFRKCNLAKDTQTLQKLYNMMEDNIDHATDKFIEKFNFFSIVSTKEEFSMLRFEPGGFYKEHIECSSLNDDSDGSSRRICVYMILEAPERGGVFEFSYQGTKIKPEVGSIIMFPSCPLHPLRITKVQSGNLMYVNNFLL